MLGFRVSRVRRVLAIPTLNYSTEPPADDHQRARRAYRQLHAHRQRDAERQRDGAACEYGGRDECWTLRSERSEQAAERSQGAKNVNGERRSVLRSSGTHEVNACRCPDAVGAHQPKCKGAPAGGGLVTESISTQSDPMKPIASLSLDLDNKWSYMKTHGDAGWESFPSYLDMLVPRVLDLLESLGLTITFFVVGQDAALEKNAPSLKQIADAGHEIGNHSFRHEPWLHLYSDEEIETELRSAQEAIRAGHRLPPHRLSRAGLQLLAVPRSRRSSASATPTTPAPSPHSWARWPGSITSCASNLSKDELTTRKALFGSFTEGFRPLKPYCWRTAAGELIEIPVTTMPLVQGADPCQLPAVPELLFRRRWRWPGSAPPWRCAGSPACSRRSCCTRWISSGCDDESDLSFFPAMNLRPDSKMSVMERILKMLARRFDVVPMREHAVRASYSAGHEVDRSEIPRNRRCPRRPDPAMVWKPLRELLASSRGIGSRVQKGRYRIKPSPAPELRY